MGSVQNRCLFTPSQREEFKDQALIYRYIVSGVLVPTDLLFALKRSLDSSLTLFPRKQDGDGIIWGLTGKKTWNLGGAKELMGRSGGARRESKYCERHMHRGRNSSRKPVKLSITTSTTSPSPVMKIHSNSEHDQPSIQTSALIHPASLHSQSSSRHQNCSTRQLLLESGSSYQKNKDFRLLQGMRNGERAFFPRIFKTVGSQQESYMTSKMASSDYFQTLNDHGKLEDQARQEEDGNLKQHCFIFGNDFKPAKSIKEDRGEENQKTIHHFFSEWPLKSKAHWPDNEENQSNHASLSNTQLSTSTPLPTLELFHLKPRLHWY